MATTGTLPFTVNERVLCYHGPLVYEAKILKTEMWDETNTKLAGVGPHFFVHYKGWKQTCVCRYEYVSPRSSYTFVSICPCYYISFVTSRPQFSSEVCDMFLRLIHASFL